MSSSALRINDENSGIFPMWVKLPLRLKQCVLGANSFRKATFINEIKLTPTELQELRDCIKDYDYPAQRWIQPVMKLTRVRRKWLQAILFEAGAGHDSCWYQSTPATKYADEDWGHQLHRVWHKLYSGGGDE